MHKGNKVLQELDLQVLRRLNQTTTQKSLASEIGVSVGKLNYIVNALIDKGLVKVENFKNSNNKTAYKYLLTPKGFQEKLELTKYFIDRKKKEYEELQNELEQLRRCL